MNDLPSGFSLYVQICFPLKDKTKILANNLMSVHLLLLFVVFVMVFRPLFQFFHYYNNLYYFIIIKYSHN